MHNIKQEVGKNIRTYRKMRQLTLEQLAQLIFKSKSAISKYEKGEIALDIETLYDIAKALDVSVDKLLYYPQSETARTQKDMPAFFKNVGRFYGYFYDGRANILIRCLFIVIDEIADNTFKLMMYMNINEFDSYQNCENTYTGHMEHYDAITNIFLTNQDSPMEKASVQILAAFLDAPVKWGLFNGFSSRPMMPVASKMLLSKEKLVEDEQLISQLKISKEDIRLLKLYNMFSVT